MKIISILSLILLLILSGCFWVSEKEDTQETNWITTSENWIYEYTITPRISAFPDQAFRALGTEPFWSFTYEDQSFEWSEPGEEDIHEESHFVQQIYIESEDMYFITGDFIAVQIFEETCSDGMSDDIFDYTVTWNYFDMDLQGCAEEL